MEEAIGSGGPAPTYKAEMEQMKKDILTEINSDFRDSIIKDASEMLGKKVSVAEIAEGEEKSLQEKVDEHIEETKKATNDLKVQVLKVATALKVAN